MELNYNNKRFFHEDLRTILEKFYSVEVIRNLFVLIGGKGRSSEAPSLNKARMVEALLDLSRDDSKSRTLFGGLSENAQRACELLVWRKQSNMVELEAALDARIVIPESRENRHGYRHHGYSVPPEYNLIVYYTAGRYSSAWDYHWRDKEEKFYPERIHVTLPPAIKDWFRRFLPKPHHYEFVPLDEPPTVKGRKVRLFNGAEDAVFIWRLTADAILRKTLPLTVAGFPTKPSMRKLVKASTAREFFDGPDDAKELRELRHECLFGMLTPAAKSDVEKLVQRPFPAEELFAKIVPELLRQHQVIATAAPHILPPEAYAQTDTEGLKNLSMIFGNLPVNKWVSKENLLQWAHLRELRVSHTLPSHTIARITQKSSYSYSLGAYSTGVRIEMHNASLEEFDALVIDPLLQGVAFLLAGGGLLDIAYTQPQENEEFRLNQKVTYLTPFSGLVAVRLNPIGAYAFRKTKVLDLGIEETPECTIHYSPDKLVAIAKNLDPVTERILTEHLERLSPTVYRLTRKSLFGKVTTPRELEDRVKAFRDHLPGEPPPNWEAFLKECLSTPPPLNKRKTTMVIYSLSEDPEVRRLFATDPVLSRLSLKVEGWRVAIDQSDITRVRARLREFGYLLNV